MLTDVGGYRLDAVVEADGAGELLVGVEADGPSHFVGAERPNGATLLKRRQVASLDGMPVVSVPYWEWYELGTDRERKRQYLREAILNVRGV